MPARNRRPRHDHSSTRSHNLAEHGVQPAVAAQVDHRPLASWSLEAPLDQCARHARLFGGKDANLLLLMFELIHLHSAIQNRLVESLRPAQITGRNLEPGHRRRSFRPLLAHNFLLYLATTPEA